MDNDTYLDLMEMKMVMEKLGAPQTHIGLKQMIEQIDEDHDGKVSFREVWQANFLLSAFCSKTIELQMRGFFRVLINSCRMYHHDVRCCKALWFQSDAVNLIEILPL